jgi:hypothetical protein
VRAGEGRLAEQLLVDREVAGGAGRERALQLVMADEGGALGLERGVAEHVVGMHVRVDDVLDRQLGAGADRFEQLLADARAAAGVDDGDRLVADDETGVGGIAGVARVERLVAAFVHEDAGGNFVNSEGLGASGDGRGSYMQDRCNTAHEREIYSHMKHGFTRLQSACTVHASRARPSTEAIPGYRHARSRGRERLVMIGCYIC